jgi:hypothetical protein
VLLLSGGKERKNLQVMTPRLSGVKKEKNAADGAAVGFGGVREFEFEKKEKCCW